MQILKVLAMLMMFSSLVFAEDSNKSVLDSRQTRLYTTSSSLKPLYVNYDVYDYGISIVHYAVDRTFFISEDSRINPPELYKPKPVKAPLLSLMVVEKKDEAIDKKEKFEQVGTEVEHVVYFGFNRYRLKKEHKEILDKINLKGGEIADIYGYACVIGPKTYNKWLSQKRADAVAEYLREKGVSVGVVVGKGETNEEREISKNRKVVLKIKK